MSFGCEKLIFAWRPVRLAIRIVDPKDGAIKQLRFVGWAWLQRVRLFKNVNYGWIAFAEDQTDEKLCKCPHCGRALEGLK